MYLYFFFLRKRIVCEHYARLKVSGAVGHCPRASNIVHSGGERHGEKKEKGSVRQSFLTDRSCVGERTNSREGHHWTPSERNRIKKNRKKSRSTHSIGTDQQGGVGSLLLVFCRIVDNAFLGQSWSLYKTKKK